MISVNIHEAKTNLSKILRTMEEKGETVRICRNGKPIAEVRPLIKKIPDRLTPDPRLRVILHEDPMLPLDKEDWGDLWCDFDEK